MEKDEERKSRNRQKDTKRTTDKQRVTEKHREREKERGMTKRERVSERGNRDKESLGCGVDVLMINYSVCFFPSPSVYRCFMCL